MDSKKEAVILESVRLALAVNGHILSFRHTVTQEVLRLAARGWNAVATPQCIDELVEQSSSAPYARTIVAKLEQLALARIEKSTDLHGDNIGLISKTQALVSAAVDEVLREG